MDYTIHISQGIIPTPTSSSTSFRDYFKMPDMLPGGEDKMVLDAAISRSRISSFPSPQRKLPSQDHLPAQFPAQCMDAYPRMLRAASDPGIQEGSPDSPTPSYGTEDFPALQGPRHSQAYSEPEGGSRPPYTSRPVPASPKAQRQSRIQLHQRIHRDPPLLCSDGKCSGSATDDKWLNT